MTPRQDKPNENQPQSKFIQSIFSRVRAAVIQVGRIIQVINNISIFSQNNISIGSPNEKQRRFILAFLLGGSIALIVAGFKNLLIDGLIDDRARLLLIVGCSLFAIICSYYAFFWNPPISPCSKATWKFFAAVGMVVIPLSTGAGVSLWMNAPTNTIVTFANYHVNEKDPNASRVGDFNLSTRKALEMEIKNQEEKDIEIQQINKEITEDKEARTEAKNRRAAISIWGQYVTTNPNIKDWVKVTSLIELLKKPPVVFIPKQAKEKYEQAKKKYEQAKEPYEQNGYLEDVSEDGLRPSKLSIKVTNNNKEPILKLKYYAIFVDGLAHYESGLAHCEPKKNVMSKEAKKSFEKARKSLESVAKYLMDIQENEPELNQLLNKQNLDFITSVTNFYLGNTHVYATSCSNQHKDYNLAIDRFTEAIQLIFNYNVTLDNRQNYYVVEYPYRLILASYTPKVEYSWSFDDSVDNQERICGNKRQDENVWVSNSVSDFKILLSRIYYNRGIAYAMKGDSENALADFKKAIQLDDRTNEFCIGLGSAYAELGNYNSAIKIYESVIGKTNFAIKIYERAIGETPDIETSLAYNNLVNIYLRRGDKKQASKKYKEAIGLDSNIFKAYDNEKRAKFFEEYDNEKRAKFFEELKNSVSNSVFRYFPMDNPPSRGKPTGRGKPNEKGKGKKIIPSTPPKLSPILKGIRIY